MGTRRIATCCYCGTRAALVLAGTVHHELACSRCGAPLHDLKIMPAAAEGTARPGPLYRGRTSARHALPAPGGSDDSPRDRRRDEAPAPRHDARPRGPSARRKTRTTARRILGKIWDAIEDVID